MKRIFLLFTICLLPLFCNAQKNYVYCELVGTGKVLSSKVNVQADFGQKTSIWKGVDYVKGDDEKPIKFNSMVDAMNYFGQQGWEFVQAYVVSTNNQNVYHWLLKKEVTAEELNAIVSSEEEG